MRESMSARVVGSLTCVGVIIVLAVVEACSGQEQQPPGCTPGATQACLGDGQCRGVQICESSGTSWGACDCAQTGGVDASATSSSDAETSDANGSEPNGATVSMVVAGALLIDDESSFTGEISLTNGGYWGTFGTGSITPPPGDPFLFTTVDAGAISRAACFSGSDVTSSIAGADFRLQFEAADGSPIPYDASAYSGVSFYVMSPDTSEVAVYFQDTNTDRFWPGATCAGGASAGPVPDGGYPEPPCGDGALALVPLNASWQQRTLAFTNISSSPGNGYYAPPSLDAQGLITMGFQVYAPVPGASFSFSVCVAEIYFTQ
jgi:hypothetical protein